MKNLFALIIILLALTSGYAQKKPKILPPLPMHVPPPPKPEPSFKETQKLEADPLREHLTTFWADSLYTKTDSSFLVEQWIFSPSGLGEARLTRDVYSYPRQYTKDSLIQNGNKVVSLTKETYFQDGDCRYNKQPPKEADKLIFTDKKTKQRIVFIIKWDGKGGDKKVIGLTDEAKKTNWKQGDPPAAAPMGY